MKPRSKLAEAMSQVASIGDLVSYVDHHNRLQAGEVLAINARWNWDEPHLQYTVWHPSYRNQRIYVSEIRRTKP